MKLIIGLGNPGDKYLNTRHNAGFLALDDLRTTFQCEDFKRVIKHKARISEGQINGEKVLLVKPQTFMNLSGRTVQSLVHFYKLSPQDVIVIYDEVDIDSGKLRIRQNGSAGGHNGIKSIIQCLGTDGFIRIRLGVKPVNPFRGELADYVLGQLSSEEKDLMDQNFQKLPKLLEVMLSEGVLEAMNQFN